MNIFSQNSKIKFPDLYKREGLLLIDEDFQKFLEDVDVVLAKEFSLLKENAKQFNQKEEANILIAVAKVLEQFLANLFGILEENQDLKEFHESLALIYKVKKDFIQRKVARQCNKDDKLRCPKDLKIKPKQNQTEFELEFSYKFLQNQDNEVELEKLKQYASWALFSDEGKKLHEDGTLFNLAQKIDFENLVDLNISDDELKTKSVVGSDLKQRDGFKLTDSGYNLNQVLGQANYCIFCHNQGKDSCKTGLFEKESSDFKKDFFGQELQGCPLEERISEMNLLKSQGFSIASLAIAVVDNPMIAATGHRICNDCMKSCIYQKQDPVDIPQIESRVLKDVLNLSYGFEIYALLTRWNPLNLDNPMIRPDSGYKILVAGLGPAGFTLAHYLLSQGHLVVGIDGLKIEPLDPKISGIDLTGKRSDFKPIKDIKEIYEDLDQRIVGGFGGVVEYGITSRWDKNFLKIIRLILERNQNFRMFGGMRLGSAFDCKDALNELDFDHVALCLGAGWPNILNIKNNFVKGVRSASDFLMALQLTGAMSDNLMTNLQVRLPILVVGAGLTAIDTACEALAYYVKQVERFATRYDILCQKIGQKKLEKSWSEEEKEIALEFLDHHKKIEQAKKDGKNITKLLQDLGGAKLVYRKNIKEAPSYKTNHLEIQKALEEGLEIIDEAKPVEIIKDEFNYISHLLIKKDHQNIKLRAKSLFVAIGTSPNKAPAYEDKLEFGIDNNSFAIIDLDGQKLQQQFSPKAKNIGFLAAKNSEDEKAVSFFGDTHKAFAGSVVKAMASAKKGYKVINKSLHNLIEDKNYSEFFTKINQQFSVKVSQLNILSDHVFELVVHAPILAQKTKLGHIFRMHNYHTLAAKQDNTVLAMEGVALTTYKVDQKNGLISTMIINAGASSSMVKNLKIGENIIFMGPSGSPAHIAQNKEVVFLAAGRGVFPLASLAYEHKKQGCKVTLFCGFRKNSDIVRLEELEDCCDNLVIAIEEKPQIKSKKAQFFQGTLPEAFLSFAQENQVTINLNYSDIDLIFTMGNEEMMHKIAQIRHHDLKDQLKDSNIGIASLNNPMQCMLKGVCSQCLQKKIDENTGQERYFYACIAQDQKMAEIDFEFLKNRCQQNSLSEKLSRDWLQYGALAEPNLT